MLTILYFYDNLCYNCLLVKLGINKKECGFISGKQEITNWERSDLFQFYHDTTPIFGSIDFLLPLIDKDDIHRAIRIGACNIYHSCSHNMVHEKDAGMLAALYKSAAFTIQAVYYTQSETYIKQKTRLLALLRPQEQEVLKVSLLLKDQPDMAQAEFEQFSNLLFSWSSELIIKYKADL